MDHSIPRFPNPVSISGQTVLTRTSLAGMLSRVKKLISLAALGLAVMTGALAQSIDFSSLPQCAQPPILNTIGRSKCDPTKPQCLCTDDAIVNDLVALIAKSCSGDDLTSEILPLLQANVADGGFLLIPLHRGGGIRAGSLHQSCDSDPGDDI